MKPNEPTPLRNLLSTDGKRFRTMPPDFDEISLTPEEQEYAIYDARCGKYFDERDRKEKALKAKEMLDCMTPFTTDQLREWVLKNNPHFQVDDQNKEVFELLCQYFANDPLFANTGFSLAKGILLSGPVGVGKTELLKVFSKNKKQCFHLISVFEIEKYCQDRGVEYYDSYTGMVPGWGNSKDFFYQKSIGWAFDDIGRESMVFDFGNKAEVVSKIIQTRYTNKSHIPFSSLHLTTNLTGEELEGRYDYAVKSRLREMFNYIPIDGKDRR